MYVKKKLQERCTAWTILVSRSKIKVQCSLGPNKDVALAVLDGYAVTSIKMMQITSYFGVLKRASLIR